MRGDHSDAEKLALELTQHGTETNNADITVSTETILFLPVHQDLRWPMWQEVGLDRLPVHAVQVNSPDTVDGNQVATFENSFKVYSEVLHE